MYRIAFMLTSSAMLALAVPAVASAQSASDPAVAVGITHWQAGRFDSAVAAWRAPAERGDAEAQFRLAQALRDGQGIAPDPAKAEDLFGKAARQGHMEASDEYGILLFQSARIKEALPWLQASAERGEPRARYYLGIASFNGDDVAKDWVRAYALMTRAAASGLEPAVAALKQMDESISLEDRRKAIVLAEDMEVIAREARNRHLASADLSAVPVPASSAPQKRGPVGSASPVWPDAENVPKFATAPASPVRPANAAKPIAAPPASPKTAAQKPAEPKSAPVAKPAVTPVAKPVVKAKAAPTPAHAPAPVVTANGKWRIQLGAFSQKGNADALWAKVRGAHALAGRKRFDVVAGPVIRLQSGPFASQSEARSACAALAGQCFVLQRP